MKLLCSAPTRTLIVVNTGASTSANTEEDIWPTAEPATPCGTNGRSQAVTCAKIQGEQKKTTALTNSIKKSFSKDLCFALISTNIPLNKVSNQSFHTFLGVYTGNNVPTETNLRRGYIDDIFDETMSKIKLELSVKKVWVSIDETTNIEGRFVCILEADYK
ncbi:hypothetical protein QTP88_016343 [Uroleucon formosanum]